MLCMVNFQPTTIVMIGDEEKVRTDLRVFAPPSSLARARGS